MKWQSKRHEKNLINPTSPFTSLLERNNGFLITLFNKVFILINYKAGLLLRGIVSARNQVVSNFINLKQFAETKIKKKGYEHLHQFSRILLDAFNGRWLSSCTALN